MAATNSTPPPHVIRCLVHPMPAVSNGFLQGDIPLDFALPLLTVQIALVLLVTRSMASLFKRVKQPRVLAEIIGGVLLGPTALGRNKAYLDRLFPSESIPLLETVATMGLMFFIFMVGLELDLQALRKTGKRAFLIAVAGIGVPFGASAGLASLVRSTISQGARLGPLIVFMGAPLSISAFSVLVRIMAELKLLSTDVGKLAVPSAAVNDVAVWTLLAVGVAMAGPKHEPLIPLWVLLCGVGFGIMMLTLVRMFMTVVAHRATKKVQGQGSELYVCITLVGVLLAGLVTDAIGVHPLLGPFLLGLVIPKDNEFPKIIIEKIEDFVTGLMLPLFFASSGLKTNLGALHGVVSLGFFVLFFATAAIGKIAGTFVAARLSGLPTRRALILGFLMNTKGLAVLIVLNIGRDLKALTDETFAILVLTCLLTSFVTFPAVSALCRLPAGAAGGADSLLYEGCNMESVERSKQQLRILACADDNSHYAALVNLVEASRGSKKTATANLKLYTLRLIQLSDRASAILMLNRPPTHLSSTNTSDGTIVLSFQASSALSKVKVKPLTAIANFHFLPDDICKLAVEKRATIIILPYHKPSPHATLLLAAVDDMHGFYKAYHRVLNNAPCSVGILVDKASMGASAAIHPCFFSYKVVALFIGGPDDREALSLGCRMADHPGVALKVFKLTSNDETHHQIYQNADATTPGFNLDEKKPGLSSPLLDATQERSFDDEAISRFKEKALECSFVYEEKHIAGGQSLKEVIQVITKALINEVNLFVVGRGRLRPRLTPCDDSCDSNTAETSMLGLIGDVLAAPGSDFHASILVVQQHRADLVAKSPPSAKLEETAPSSSKLGMKPSSSSFDSITA